jgi:hypothetical protein
MFLQNVWNSPNYTVFKYETRLDCRLVCDAVSSGRRSPTFRRRMLPQYCRSSTLKMETERSLGKHSHAPDYTESHPVVSTPEPEISEYKTKNM